MTDPWRRKEAIGGCTLYPGDCNEVLPVVGRCEMANLRRRKVAGLRNKKVGG